MKNMNIEIQKLGNNMICGDVMAQDEWCRQLFKNEEIRQELIRVVRRKNGMR